MEIIHRKIDSYNVSFIRDSVFHYSFGYFTANKWIDDKKIVLVRGRSYLMDEFNKTAELVMIDITDGTEELLHTFNFKKKLQIGAGFGESYVVNGNMVYFIDYEKDSDFSILYKYDMISKSKKIIYKGINCYFPHITNDGRFLNIELLSNEDDDLCHCVLIDTLTEKSEIIFSAKFNKPFQYLAHIMVCPTDKYKIFFCHEGDTFYVSNRLWMYEKGKGIKCIAEQRLDNNGNLGDCFGHESWAPDGKGLYFVKYNCSPVEPRGISYVNSDGTGQRTAIYSKYPYWHVSSSSDGRFLASDTQNGNFSGVCLIDTLTNSEKMIYKANTDWNHPSHPHPSFSIDNKKLIFHSIEENMLSIGIFNLKDYR